MSKLTQDQRLRKAHVFLMNHKETCLFSGIILIGTSEVVEGVPTAYTDGINVKYGEAFLAGLTDPEVRGLVLHETMHKAYKHMFIWKHLYKKNPQLANMACDYVINIKIYDLDPEGKEIKLPAGGCLDEKYRGMDAYQVYRLLEKQANGQGKGGSGDTGQPLDEHDWEAGQAMDEPDENGVTMSEKIDSALRQGQVIAGRKGGSGARGFMEDVQPQVNWREVLQEFVQSVSNGKDMSSWRRPNRRWVHQGVYMPSSVSERVNRITVAIDTSGSVSNDELSAYMAEVQAACTAVSPETVDIIYWGSDVVGHEIYVEHDVENILSSTKPQDGGGTDVSTVPVYLKAKSIDPDCVLILTDGYTYGSWGDWPWPTLTCCTTTVTAPMGQTVRLQV